MIKPYKNRITTKTTTTVLATSCVVFQIVIACAASGTAWTLKIQDKSSSPSVLVPAFTLAVPTDGKPIIINFEKPLPMEGGIDIITAGTTAGEASVWTIVGTGQ